MLFSPCLGSSVPQTLNTHTHTYTCMLSSSRPLPASSSNLININLLFVLIPRMSSKGWRTNNVKDKNTNIHRRLGRRTLKCINYYLVKRRFGNIQLSVTNIKPCLKEDSLPQREQFPWYIFSCQPWFFSIEGTSFFTVLLILYVILCKFSLTYYAL